jgi:DNA-binding beta-propeller fold protein YncE
MIRSRFVRFVRPLAILAALAAAGVYSTPAFADNTSPTYTRTGVIPVPGGLKFFDISFVERSGQTYYLADRSNKAVDFFDASSDTFVTRVAGFVGQKLGDNEHSGPNGVVVVHDQGELWAADGDSTVKVIELATNQIVANISTGGRARADELSYDQKNKLILVANDADDPPFVTLIDTRSREIVGKISFPDATNGLEQSVWDQATHLFYQTVPEIGGDPNTGGIAVIDPITRSIVTTHTVKNCQPAGLALGPKQHLLLGCSGDNGVLKAHGAQVQIMDARTGDVVVVIRKVGGADEVWYNPGDKHYYVAARNQPGGPVLGVIDAMSDTWIQNVSTGPNAHSVAANPINDHIYVPLRPNAAIPGCANGCIGVYQQQ